MADPNSDPSTFPVLADILVSDGYVPLHFGGNVFEIRYQSGYVTPDNYDQSEEALNVIITVSSFALSPTGSSLIQGQGEIVWVNVTNDPNGQGSGATRLLGQPIVNINTAQVGDLYRAADGTYREFNLQHIVNHELVHIFGDPEDTSNHNAITNAINGETLGGPPRSNDYFDTIQQDSCFGPEVPIDMWPLDPDLKPGPDGLYDQDAVRARIWRKPIERIRVGDIVVSFDKNDNLVPGPVTRTFQNTVKILLDFYGTRVTPGHVYYRPDSKRSHKFETLVDILRDDGIIQHQDGTLIRAATNVPVGSPRDGFVRVITGRRKADGTIVQSDAGRIRLGTRFLVRTGTERKSFAVADLIEAGGGVVGDDGLIRVGEGPGQPFYWEFGNTLPKPEDFVLACSGTTLEDIYMAAEWESQGPRLPAPMVLDRGPVQPLKGAALSAMPRNEPLNVVHVPMAPPEPQHGLNRKQRKAMEANQRKTAKSGKRIAG